MGDISQSHLKLHDSIKFQKTSNVQLHLTHRMKLITQKRNDSCSCHSEDAQFFNTGCFTCYTRQRVHMLNRSMVLQTPGDVNMHSTDENVNVLDS